MTDEMLDPINKKTSDAPACNAEAVRIDRLRISNYRFFYGDFELDFKGSNVLMYGENGSGKSSVYRALEFLTKNKFGSVAKDRNIFSDQEPEIRFKFTNGKELVIHGGLTELPEGTDFIKGLSVFIPMLDYRKLLKVHYSPAVSDDNVNVYDMLRLLFKDYPVGNRQMMSDIRDPAEYFDALKSLVNNELIGEVNLFISYFEWDFKIRQFVFGQKFAADERSVEPFINIEIDFKDRAIGHYHSFLNEARLSALAVSVYFAVIRKLIGTLTGEYLKILVLDDLLISLDMSNRLKLLEILRTQFTDFQIFFFTHDKSLFELYKHKMSWEKYELYLDDASDIQMPVVKKGSSEMERAKEFYACKEYDCCALFLRKAFEKTLKSYLIPNLF
jgi:energy-coupling factor transporter ATP-binding protein EcfA2